MSKVRIVTAEERLTPEPLLGASEEVRQRLLTRMETGKKRQYFPVDDERLQLFEDRVNPDEVVEPHAHTADEIMLVTEGEIIIGKRVLGAGTAVYVPEETLYGFKAGPSGATFLNFRPTAKVGYLTSDELLERRRSARAGDGADSESAPAHAQG